MGRTNSYVITIPKKNLKIASDYVLSNCERLESKPSDPLDNGCVSLTVKLDVPIKRYLRSYYANHRFSSFYQEDKIEDCLHDGNANIGCISTYTKIHGDKANLNFLCVAGSLSDLFTDSKSIRNWFVKLCEITEAETGVFSRENYYLELFWYKGSEKTLRINETVYNEIYPHQKTQPYKKLIAQLLKAGFDYAYEHARK